MNKICSVWTRLIDKNRLRTAREYFADGVEILTPCRWLVT
jgi:hypothetical protein